MAIYRGLGGAGSNEQDASITVITQKALEADTSATNAAASASAAAASVTAALASETAAAASELAASISEVNAAESEVNANTSAVAALASAESAFLSQTQSTYSVSATAFSAAAALESETAAAASAAAALAIYGDTTDVAAAVAAAAASETAADASETAAAASEVAAAASETAAATSEANAATSASEASTSASNASASATAALASETAAAASYDAFDDRYLGAKTSDPDVDNDGNALLTGALYFDSVTGVMKVFSGTNWVAAYASLSGAMFGDNNLSDVANAATSRSNLGLGSAAEQDVSAFIAPNSTATLYSLTTTDGMEVGGTLVVTGNLTVNGTTTTIDTANLAVEDNMIYLNSGNAVTNPDLGIAGNYNDGTYAHAGFFRDSTDGRWKAFDGYTPEPDASPEIDTSHASFTLADIQATTFYGALVGNASTATLAATATNVAYSGLTGTIPTWNQDTTGNAATADYATIAGSANDVPYENLTGTIPTWNQDTTGNAATATTANSLTAGDWTVEESGGVLYFKVSGVNKAKLDTSGDLTVVGNVTAYGSV